MYSGASATQFVKPAALKTPPDLLMHRTSLERSRVMPCW